MRIGLVFRKHVERHEMGNNGSSLWQTWRVVQDLGNGVYSCVRVDSTQDPMGAASPHKRTFKESEILKHLKNNPNA
jgi:hypothetical protein